MEKLENVVFYNNDIDLDDIISNTVIFLRDKIGFNTKILIILALVMIILSEMIQKLSFMLDLQLRVIDINNSTHVQNISAENNWLLLSIKKDGGIDACQKKEKRNKTIFNQ